MALGIGSAMKEDLEREQKEKYDDGPLAISPSMKEDLKRDLEREKFLYEETTTIGSAMKEDLKNEE
jgi:hypothetical protein